MRVALVSSGLVSLPPVRGGAVEEYVFQLAKHLRRLGVDAVAVDAKWGGEHVEVKDIDGTEVFMIPVKLPATNFKRSVAKELLFGKAVAKHVKDQGFNLVHANTAWAGFALATHRNAKVHGFIYTCHNGLWLEDGVHLKERMVRLVEGYAMRSSNVVVAINKTMYRTIIEKAKVKRDRIVIVPNGVDTEFFKPGSDGDDVLKRFSLEKQSYILFVGRVSPWKGVHLLIKAFKYFIRESNTTNSIKLAVVGPLSDSFVSRDVSSYAEAIIKYAKKVLPEKVVFLGPLDKVTLRILYSHAYCLVLPSLAEAFGMVVLEAMASGIPPIGSTAGGTPDVIVDGVNGLLFKKGDWKHLAEKLFMLLNDKSFRDKLAANARRDAEDKYSWSVIASKVKEAYVRVAL
jgi:glycosyltransferase involved in cell wall biosynthesis